MTDLGAIRRAVDPDAPAHGNVRCPVHDDRRPSLSLALGEDGRLLVHCKSGCEQRAVFDAVRQRAGHLLNGTARMGSGKPSQIVYEYKDPSGKPLARVLRKDAADGSKDFRQQTPDGNGGWQWKGPQGLTPLYGLDRLAQDTDATAILCEGEKAAEAAQRQLGGGFVCLSWMGGAGAVARADLEPLRGRDVVIWPDNDPAGLAAAGNLCGRLRGLARAVKIVRVSDLPPKADAADVAWAADDLLGRLEEPQVTEPATHDIADRRDFELMTVRQLRATPAPQWLVVDALPARGLCVLYGEPGSGKSFFVLDLVAHICRGQPWAGRRTRKASVVYVSLEGHLRDRVEAYQAHHGLCDGDLDGLRVIQGQPLDLLSDGAAAQLAASIRAALGDHDGAVVVVLDTLARAMPGGNENAGEDMGAAIAACGALERELGALVILVHHAGKDLSRGARGWSGLRGAADAEILIERDGDNRQAKLAKVKDGIDGAAVQFSLQVVDLGPRSEVDPDAGPAERRSSCVAAVTDAHAKPKPNAKTLGRNQRMLLAALRNGPMTRHEAHAFMEKAGVPRRSRYDAIDALLVAGLAIDSATGLRVKE